MDKETLSIFKQNEILDIEKVIETYNSYIYKILKNNISNEQDIEEILSDVFIVFWKNYKVLDNNTEIKPYLLGITRNLIKKKYREYASRQEAENVDLYEQIISNINIEELAESEEKSKVIQDSLDQMKDIEKEIFIMFYYNQKKIKDISKMLKITEAKVKIILHRARKNIRKRLRERGYSYGK